MKGVPFKIRIVDYQSIHDCQLKVVDGLNVIVGPTNTGKTAILRAIRDCIFNSGSDDKIRAGTKGCAVVLQTNNQKVLWKRRLQGKNEKTSYQINGGDELKKVGVSQVPEVANAFNIRDVVMPDKEKVRLNFWWALEKPFLTEATPYKLYNFLSVSSCDEFLGVLKTIKADIKINNELLNAVSIEIDTFKTLISEHEEYLESNKGFDDVFTRFVVFKDSVDNYYLVSDLLQNLKAKRLQYVEIRDAYDEANSRLESIKPSFESVSKSYTLYKNKVEVGKELGRLLQQMERNDKLLVSLDKDCNINTRKLDSIVPVFQDMGFRLKALEKKKLLDSTTERLIKSISVNKSKLEKLGSDIKVPNIDDLAVKYKELFESKAENEKLYTLLKALKSKNSDLVSVGDGVIELEKKLVDAKTELQKYKEEIGYCPLCNSKL